MKSLSEKEIEVISNLEFDKRYFFTRKDIEKFFKTQQNISDFVFGLRKKERIIKINRRKYYLVPIKAKSGGWSENSLIIADEICDGKDYYIGGWSAAKYHGLTDQIPMQVDIYTTRRQGNYRIMNTRFVFHRIDKSKIGKEETRMIEDHSFRIMPKDEAKEWISQRK